MNSPYILQYILYILDLFEPNVTSIANVTTNADSGELICNKTKSVERK